jgi:hypothetical protein
VRARGPALVVVSATTTVRASPQQVLSFVLDLARYREADHKIARVRWQERRADEVLAALWTRAGPLPVPVTQRLVLSPWERIDVTNEPSVMDRLVGFHGEFVCRGDSPWTEVTHRYRFELHGPARLAAPLLRRVLQRDIEQEVARLRAILERDANGAANP